MTDKRKDCPMRHENGNCTVSGGFCTAVNDPICEALHNAFDCGYRSALRQQGVPDKNVGKITNADRIRAMSDEELATFISEIADECERNTECNQHCYGCDIEYCVRESCLKWLQQPAEEDDHA